jgi:FMN phosphatase YigB (HAD superfamily)
LIKHKDACEIVTTYLSRDPQKNGNKPARESFQIKKLALCGITELLGEDHVHIVEESKKEILIELKQRFESETPPEKCVYVDDRENYVDAARELGIPAYKMDRVGPNSEFEKFLSFPEKGVIRSFDGFESLVEADFAGNEASS